MLPIINYLKKNRFKLKQLKTHQKILHQRIQRLASNTDGINQHYHGGSFSDRRETHTIEQAHTPTQKHTEVVAYPTIFALPDMTFLHIKNLSIHSEFISIYLVSDCIKPWGCYCTVNTKQTKIMQE